MSESTHWDDQRMWAQYLSFSYQLTDPEMRADATGLARSVMRRARRNVETLVLRLKESGYRFADSAAAFRPPDPYLDQRISSFESQGMFVPLSLLAWWQEVGSVNLMGSHPAWGRPAYRFTDVKESVLLTEPLVVAGPDALDEFENWQVSRDLVGENYLSSVGPFRIPIAPDDLHKANLSGGSPYEMWCDAPAMDSLVLNQRHCVSLLAYLRIAFSWAGFPGFECIPNAPHEWIENLRGELLPM